ncbi:alpha-galactosidase [Microlunatus sagamiharensis]|uniref:Alpha-galactosidase n=1 Tax=Microlunatus sagamiharensis TaxID=546874 RepID=A0A1H2MR94_9ACTN|nr:alpha-galactosidase [Microlunatus sagamiharensis]SDU95720.1 alpha-galactosidase [Microlunatus sagamiharensis]
MPTPLPPTCIALGAAGVSLVLDLAGDRLPSVLHWGAQLPPLTDDDALALSEAVAAVPAPSSVDAPVRIALLPEHWTGWTGRPGLSGSRAGAGWSPKFVVTGATLDGAAVAPDRVTNAGAAVLVVEAADADARLELRLTVELTPEGLVRLRARVTSGADGYAVQDLVLALPVPAVAREVLDLAGRWGKERVPQRSRLDVGTHLREGRRGRTGPDAATVLHVGTPGFGFASGEVWAVHTGWSGNHTHYAERLSTGEQVVGGGELLLPGEVVLAAGESYESPWVYAAYGTGLDEVARRFHRFLRARPQHPSTERPVTINVWEAVYFDHANHAKLIELARLAAAAGVERYVLDDGWFGARRNDSAGLGDWTVSPDVWPDGLHPLADEVTRLGMQLGLWFEPEMVNEDSDVARAHPEWIMATGGRLPVEARRQQVINIGIPECYAHVRDQVLAILDEYPISYVKWDHNRDLVDAGTQPLGRAGVHEQTLAFYRLVDEIKAAHPGLEIESCSSGGARVDLGVLERTDRIWVSDCIDPLERQLMHRWTTQLVPPELMGAHVASGHSHTTGRRHELRFRAATAIWGHLGVEWDLTAASEAELAELAGWIAFYKEHRALLLGGDLVRIDCPDDALLAGGVVAHDRRSAIYSFASVSRSDVAVVGTVPLPGLDPDLRYSVTPVMTDSPPAGLVPPRWWHAGVTGTEDHALAAQLGPRRLVPEERGPVVLTGAALGRVGLTVPPTHPEQAAVYLVEAVR